MEEWDNEAEAIIQNMPSKKPDIDTEKINTTRIKSKSGKRNDLKCGNFRNCRREGFSKKCRIHYISTCNSKKQISF